LHNWVAVFKKLKTVPCINHFMPIPSLPSSRPWSIDVQNAHQKLDQIFETASSYINSGSLESHRLQYYGETIIAEAYPLLLLLAETASSESLLRNWIEQVATDYTSLLALIDDHWVSASDEYVITCLSLSN
jgi:hypothetical protein